MKLPVDYTLLNWAERRDVRNQYVRIQNGLCSHCNSKLDAAPAKKVLQMKINGKLFPANFFKYPVHLHHNHETGMTIGAVHNHCNAVLWQYHGE